MLESYKDYKECCRYRRQYSDLIKLNNKKSPSIDNIPTGLIKSGIAEEQKNTSEMH